MPTTLTYREIRLGRDQPFELEHEPSEVVTVLGAEEVGGGSDKPILLRVVVISTSQQGKKR